MREKVCKCFAWFSESVSGGLSVDSSVSLSTEASPTVSEIDHAGTIAGSVFTPYDQVRMHALEGLGSRACATPATSRASPCSRLLYAIPFLCTLLFDAMEKKFGVSGKICL